MAKSFVQLIKGNVLMFILNCYIFLIRGLVVNFLMVCNLIVLRFNKQLYRTINYYLVYLLQSHFCFAAHWWADAELILYMDPEDRRRMGKEHSLLLCNHIYELDWLMTIWISERFDMLGNFKVYAKDQFKYIPIFGWTYCLADNIILKRDFAKDEKIIQESLADLATYPDGFWVHLGMYPEGTRKTMEKYKSSLEVAEQKGYALLKHHLLPRTRGFTTTIKHMKNKLTAIYDCTVACLPNEPEPTMTDIIKANKVTLHMRIKRYNIDEVPDDEKECADWLRKLYKEKDDAVDEFLTTGKFDRPPFHLPKRTRDLYLFIFWLLVACVPLFVYLPGVFLNGSILQNTLILAVFMIVNYLFRWIIRFSEIKSSTSGYGKT